QQGTLRRADADAAVAGPGLGGVRVAVRPGHRAASGRGTAAGGGQVSSGTEPLIVAPFPGSDSQRTVPPMAPSRSDMLTKPWPPRAACGSNPGPSSVTANSRPPDSAHSRTSTA